MKRAKMAKRVFFLVNGFVLGRILDTLNSLPFDSVDPLKITIEERPVRRNTDQNALMWSGVLSDIAEQVWVEGLQFSPEVWHEYFKGQFLPEEFDPELCMPDYQKWAIDPKGDRILIGSTVKLTKRGFSEYLEQIHAFGAHHNVQFGVSHGL